ncbi:MAG: CHAT domain-containing protein [Bacteroidota bacterium]
MKCYSIHPYRKQVLILFLLCISLFLSSYSQEKDSTQAAAYDTLASHLFNEGKYDSSLHYRQLSYQLFKELDLYQLYINGLYMENNTWLRIKNIDKAVQSGNFMEKEAVQYLTEDNQQFQAIYINQANISAYQKDRIRRDVYVQKAMDWMDSYGTEGLPMRFHLSLLTNLGAYMIEEKDYFKAIEYQQRVLDEVEPKISQANWFSTNTAINAISSIGHAYSYLQEYERSVEYCLRASKLQKLYKAKDVHLSLMLNLRLARSIAGTKNYDQSLLICQEFLQLLSTLEENRKRDQFEAQFLAILSRCYYENKVYDKAELAKKRELKMWQKLILSPQSSPRHTYIGMTYLSLGKIAEAQGYKTQALDYYQLALLNNCYTFSDSNFLANPPLEDVKPSGNNLPEILIARAQLQRELAAETNSITGLDSALNSYRLLIEVTDRERRLIQKKESTYHFLLSTSRAFHESIDLCWELYQLTNDSIYIQQAFQLMERSKAVLLLESLKDTEARYQAGIPDSILQIEHSLALDIASEKDRLLSLSPTNDDYDYLLKEQKKRIFDLQLQSDQLQKNLRNDYPLYHDIRYEQASISLREVQEKTSTQNTCLLEYYWSKEAVYAIWINGPHIGFQKLDTAHHYRKELTNILNSLHTPQRFEEEHALTHPMSELYQWLIAPLIQDLQSTNKLIIIPDGPLGYLPFDILVREPSTTTPNYLIDRFAISYANSATFLSRQPPKNEESLPFIGFGPRYQGELLLPYTEKEVDELQQLMGGDGYKGIGATEEQFRTVAPDGNILHLAMHGFPDSDNPSQSYLLFHADTSTEEDGQLYAFELYNLELSAQLAVLSACHTGYGPIAKGEGIRSLALAFQYAGCPSVVMSLWEANGVVAKELMPLFYVYLKQGYSKNEALRQAKLDFLANSPEHLHDPRMWANFVLIGNPEPIEQASSMKWTWWLLAIGLILGLILWRIRSQQHA